MKSFGPQVHRLSPSLVRAVIQGCCSCHAVVPAFNRPLTCSEYYVGSSFLWNASLEMHPTSWRQCKTQCPVVPGDLWAADLLSPILSRSTWGNLACPRFKNHCRHSLVTFITHGYNYFWHSLGMWHLWLKCSQWWWATQTGQAGATHLTLACSVSSSVRMKSASLGRRQEMRTSRKEMYFLNRFTDSSTSTRHPTQRKRINISKQQHSCKVPFSPGSAGLCSFPVLLALGIFFV